MANTLVITKQPSDYFLFVLNGDNSTAIRNTRNDCLLFGNEAHFKTSNGANLIKQQNILYSNVTIIDGTALPAIVSPDDLMLKLDSVGFFDWITASDGGGGVNRFDELADTFDYFGNDGKTVIVDESQLKLIPVDFPDTSKLDKFPNNLIANKYLRVKSDGSVYEFVDLPTPEPTPITIGTADFELSSNPQTFTLPIGAKSTLVIINDITYEDWSQTGLDVTIANYEPTTDEIDVVTIHYLI